MGLTQIRGSQVQDGTVQRVDLDVSTVGQAVIRKLLAGAGLSLASDGADAGTGDVTLSAPNSANWDSAYTDRMKWDGGSASLVPGTARTSLGANALGSNIFTMANNSLGVAAYMEISSLNTPVLKTAANMLAALGGEPALGNPSANGYVLSSTTAGVRSWITPPAGTMTFTGDVTGSGTGTVNLQIAANAVTAAEIAANTIGASEMNNAQDMLMAAAQSIRVADAGNNVLNVLRISHNYTGTPTVNAEGVALSFEGKSDTTVDRTLAQIKAQWSVVADATRTSYLDLGTVASGILSTAMRLWGSNGVSVNNTTDPGAGWVNASAGFKVGNVQIGLDDLLASATNDNAATGDIGQVIEATASSVAMTNSVYKNICQITLTPGDWELGGFGYSLNASGCTNRIFCVSDVSANLPSDNMYAQIQISAVGVGLDCGTRRVSIAANQTWYLVSFAAFGAGTCTSNGWIHARRVR